MQKQSKKIGASAVVCMMRKYDDKCYYCRRTFSEDVVPSFDHVKPKSKFKGMANNLVLCCIHCNQLKGCISEEEFLSGSRCICRHVNGGMEFYSEKVRGPRRWYHGNLIQW